MIGMLKNAWASLPWMVTVLSMAFAGIALHLSHKFEVALKEEKLARSTDLLKAERTAFSRSEQLWRNKDEALEKANIRAIANRDSARATRSELDGLRDDLEKARTTSRSSGDSCPTTNDRTDTVSELLAASASALTDLAAKADRHASDALACHGAWPR